MKTKSIISILFVMVVSFASTAVARDSVVELSIDEAIAEADGKEKLIDIPYYIKGQKHPKVKKLLFSTESAQMGNSAFRTDKKACQVQFIDALLVLLQEAKSKGADGIINIVSTTKYKIPDKEYKKLESATLFRCVVGFAQVHVAIEGEFVLFVK